MSYTMYAVFTIYGITQGTGRHMEDLGLEQIHKAMMVRRFHFKLKNNYLTIYLHSAGGSVISATVSQ